MNRTTCASTSRRAVVFDFGSLGLVTIQIDAPPMLSSSRATVYGNVNATVVATPFPSRGPSRSCSAVSA